MGAWFLQHQDTEQKKSPSSSFVEPLNFYPVQSITKWPGRVFVTQLLLKGKIIYGIYTFCLLFLLWASLGDWRILYICKGMLHWCWVKRQKGKQTQFNIVIWHRDCTAFLWHPKSLCPLFILVTPDCQTEIMHIFLFSHCLSAENHWYLWWIHHKTTFSNILSKYECFQQFPCLLPW